MGACDGRYGKEVKEVLVSGVVRFHVLTSSLLAVD